MRIVLPLILLAACGQSGHQTEKSSAKRNAGYAAIKRVFDTQYTACGDSYILTTYEYNRRRPNEQQRSYIQVADLSFQVIEQELTAAEKRNGQQFHGRVIVGDDAVYREYNGRSQQWGDWYPLGLVESKLEEQEAMENFSSMSVRWFITQTNDAWHYQGALRVPLDIDVSIAEPTKSRQQMYEKVDCADVPAG